MDRLKGDVEPIRLGIMASGRGSNAEAVLQACSDARLHARGVLVVSNNSEAGVFSIAKRYGVPALHLSREVFANGKEFSKALVRTFRVYETELILLAGYMRKVPPALLRAWPKAVLNIHPAILPRHGGKGMYGRRVHEAVIRAGDPETGVTVHFVDEEYDRGPILHQVKGVPVFPGDTPELLAARVLEVEHRAYPEAVALWIERYGVSKRITNTTPGKEH